MLGIDTPAKQRALSDADGKAVGAACRHAGRAIEDCYMLNPTANRAAVFNGWKEMNDYMSKNKIEVVKPQAIPAQQGIAAKGSGGAALPASAVFEPPSGAVPTAQFIPPAGANKPGTEKTASAAGTNAATPSSAGPSTTPPKANAPAAPAKPVNQSNAGDKRVVASVDQTTVQRAKEQAHTP